MTRPRLLRSSSQGAFTLLEMLIAMTVVGFIGIMLAAALQIGFSSQKTSAQSLETSRSAELVMDALRTDLQCAMPPGGKLAVSFTGNQSQNGNYADIQFYTTAPSPLHPEGANGEIKEIELTLTQLSGANDYALIRQTLNNLLQPNGVQTEPPDQEILCRHVVGFDVRYYDGSQWLPTWDSTTANVDSIVSSLPTAIEITLTLQSPEKNSDGTQRNIPFTRVFRLPCSGEPFDLATATKSTSGGGR